MNRIEKVRAVVDSMLLNMEDTVERRCGYLHLYGVSQAYTLIALKRKENAELATISGMLHDIYCYTNMDKEDHTRKSTVMALEILNSLEIFTKEEIEKICSAIRHHSEKETVHPPFDEVLVDADVLQHCLYNPLLDEMEHEKARYGKLKLKFGLL